jgi:type IV pilus assembly protein PilE
MLEPSQTKIVIVSSSQAKIVILNPSKARVKDLKKEERMRGKRGFTLIEVLIVIIILGILATLAIPQFTNMIDRARLAEAWTGLGALRTAQAIVHMETGDYTDSLPTLGIDATHGEFTLSVVSIDDQGGDDYFRAQAAGTAGGNAEGLTAQINSMGQRRWTLDSTADPIVWSGDTAGTWPEAEE